MSRDANDPPGPLPLPLGYAGPMEAAGLRIDVLPDGGVTIVVPTRRSAGRFVGQVVSSDVLAFLFAPVAWLLFVALATRRPRAVLTLTAAELTVTETSDDGLGLWARSRGWPLGQVGELRHNRYGPGIYLTIRGRDSFDLLTDLPPDTLAAIGTALADARQRVSARVS